MPAPSTYTPAVILDEGQVWRVAGSRVSLDSVVHAYRRGDSGASIVAAYPSLSLQQTQEAISFYVSRRDEIDQYLLDKDQNWEAAMASNPLSNSELVDRIRKLK